MLLRILIAVAAVAAIAAANWASWRGVQAPPLPAAALAVGADALSWEAFAAITGDDRGVRFPPALERREGGAVEMVGVLYPLPQLVEDGHLLGAVLAPPAKFQCCGLSCEARSLSLVFVTPTGVLADPGRKRLARVTGTLRLHREPGHWSPGEIADARVTLLPDP